MTRRLASFPRLFRLLALLWVAAWLAGCATGPRTVEVPRDQLQAALAKRFPFQARFLDVVDVQASAPRLQLLPESNRVRTSVALAASSRVLRNTLQGDVEMSFGLRYEPADTSIRLADVRVERIDLQGVPEGLRGQLQRLGPFLAERMLEGAPLHTFSPDQVAKAQGWTPGEIRVTSSGLRISLLPPLR
ncbi:DUF1439 domain-containing protein [Ramlibacter sp.]|uniref:DUF1439 domain-containing protein n=1 Tax=Ramlibacter sp. TaxID=1917967 RepID=UPI001857E73B|nr:DUF1439 domain-containing protein [Ramlibacter sp.]MBA2672996.1 DUF1439 domain-containing protein [Ramlibacter sp.]